MRKLTVIFAALLICAAATAQLPNVKLTSEYGPDGEYIISAIVNVPGTYSVLISFFDVQNYNVSGNEVKTVMTNGEIMRIKRTNPNAAAGLKFKYSVVPGVAGRDRTDSSFVYVLPYSIHAKNVRYYYARELVGSLKGVRDKAFISLGFYLNEGDTIFAARKGVVEDVVDQYEAQSHYTTNKNSIMIQHPDNSYADYRSVKRGGILVEKGDVVYPGMPIAIVESSSRSSILFFTIHNLRVGSKNGDAVFERVYYNPVFATDDGNIRLDRNKHYIPVLNDELITKEMNGREKKKYFANGYPVYVKPTPATASEIAAEQAAEPEDTVKTANAQSQIPSPGVTVRSFFGQDRLYAIDAWVHGYGVYSVLTEFSEVDNYDLPAWRVDTVSVDRRLFETALSDPGKYGSVKSRYKYKSGIADVLPDTNYVYRLPFVAENNDFTHRVMKSPQSTKIIFRPKGGGEVAAMRAGIVTTVNTQSKTSDVMVTIQHEDGSSALYFGLSPEGLSAEPGVRVEAGGRLGKIADAQRGMQVILQYLVVAGEDAKELKYCSFNPVFAAANGVGRL